MRALNSLSGEEWGKPPRVVFLGGNHQVERKILLRETNRGAILKGCEGRWLGMGDFFNSRHNMYKRKYLMWAKYAKEKVA